MSSWQNNNPRRPRSREPNEDSTSRPPPRLPSLRSVVSQVSQRELESSSPASSSRPQSRNWPSTASRRAERIRYLDDSQSTLNEIQRALEHVWTATTNRQDLVGQLESSRNNVQRRADFENLDRSAGYLDEANSHLRALLDSSNHRDLASTLAPPRTPPPPRYHDFPDDARRSKRRKIDGDRLPPSYQGFHYGQYGQVVPGQLLMEMVSCDGGMFSNESSYAAENILKTDNSVYCTKGNRCNIVLRHQGATPFTLSELVIRGPTSINYSHPIREGMVFVTMDHDEVLHRTAQYQIQYAPITQDPSLYGHGNRPIYEDPPRRIVSIRHHEDGTTTRRVRHATVPRPDDDEYRIAQMPPEFASNLPNFGITTECSDEEEGAENGRRTNRHPPNRIGTLAFETTDSDDYDDSADFAIEDVVAPPRRLHSEPTGMSLAEALEASQNATQEAVRAVGGELLAPHARFLIEKKKCTCTIRFDPPISGRFILLKMWNSHHDQNSNIDIQSVTARGFAGPRYFPSLDLR